MIRFLQFCEGAQSQNTTAGVVAARDAQMLFPQMLERDSRTVIFQAVKAKGRSRDVRN